MLPEVWNWNRWFAVAVKVTVVFWPCVVVTVFAVPAVSAAVVSAVTVQPLKVMPPLPPFWVALNCVAAGGRQGDGVEEAVAGPGVDRRPSRVDQLDRRVATGVGARRGLQLDALASRDR